MNPGDRVGRLTIISEGESIKSGNQNRATWFCLCECGNTKIIRRDSIQRGFSQSCGCMQVEACTTHGHYTNNKATPTYASWSNMRCRCLTETDEHYPEYGGRGIKICERWDLFANFIADMGTRPKGKTLDRLDVNGNYEPENCRWATPREQQRNRRCNVHVIHEGRKRLLIEVCEELGKPYAYAVQRLKINKPPKWMEKECVLPA